MMSLTFGLINQVSGLGPLGPLVSRLGQFLRKNLLIHAKSGPFRVYIYTYFRKDVIARIVKGCTPSENGGNPMEMTTNFRHMRITHYNTSVCIYAV